MGGARTLARVATRPRTAEDEDDDRTERRWRRRGSSRAAGRERPTTLAPASPLPAEASDRVDALHRRRRTTPPLALPRRRNAPTHRERVRQLGVCSRRRKHRENARHLGRGPSSLRARSRSRAAFSDASRASSGRLLRVPAASPGDARSASPRGPAPPRGALARDAPRDRRRRGGGHRGGRVGSAGGSRARGRRRARALAEGGGGGGGSFARRRRGRERDRRGGGRGRNPRGINAAACRQRRSSAIGGASGRSRASAFERGEETQPRSRRRGDGGTRIGAATRRVAVPGSTDAHRGRVVDAVPPKVPAPSSRPRRRRVGGDGALLRGPRDRRRGRESGGGRAFAPPTGKGRVAAFRGPALS